MNNIYHIREGKGVVTESSLPEVAALIDAGRLMYTGQKLKWDKRAAQMCTFRYYIRVNREPMRFEPCNKPCCAYLRSNDER